MSKPWWRSSRQAEGGSRASLPVANAFFCIVMAIYKRNRCCRPRDRALSPFSETLGIGGRRKHGSYLYEADAIPERSLCILFEFTTRSFTSRTFTFASPNVLLPLFGSSDFIRVCLTMVSRWILGDYLSASHNLGENHG